MWNELFEEIYSISFNVISEQREVMIANRNR